MKKIIVCVLAVAALVSCDNGAKKRAEVLSHERDSLTQVISDKDMELDDIMGVVSEVQDGFNRINEAEGRIVVTDGNVESVSTIQIIRENMQYIQDVMQQNREMISSLKDKLEKSKIAGEKTKKMVEDLTAQLEARNIKIQELEAQLAEKNIIISRQGDSILVLNENMNLLTEENAQQARTLKAQDEQLNAAWYVFGTKSELKEQKILVDGDVLRSDAFNKEYFTKIDIRYDKEIKLYSKSAKILTNHPSGSYKLAKDNKGQYILQVTNPEQFWVTSKYLVIQVK